MTAATGLAFEMNLKPRHLMRRHSHAPRSVILPLASPVSGDVIVEGLASTTDIDLDRVAFRRNAFPLVFKAPLPPLLFRHGEKAGEILDLERLACRAELRRQLRSSAR